MMVEIGRRGGPLALLAGMVVLLCVLVAARTAEARGSVRVHNPVVEEEDGEWKLKLTIDYGAEPHLAHMPMVFSFKQTSVYERSLTDESPKKPIESRVAVQGATPINISMDVGFADATGKKFKITKFSMKLTREADFEAGEYEMTVKLPGGGSLGGRTLLKLRGNNKAIDRRSMVFSAPPPKPKPEPSEAQKELASTEKKPQASEDYGPDLSDIPDISPEEAKAIDDPNAPPPVDQKQGGCGCVVVGAAPAHGVAALALLCGLVLARRRSRSGVDAG